MKVILARKNYRRTFLTIANYSRHIIQVWSGSGEELFLQPKGIFGYQFVTTDPEVEFYLECSSDLEYIIAVDESVI
jgi:hypothetical protein